ncbi:LytTR family DNA-binding domain-containing protein [Clostridium intestinale]|uniref:LytTR family transcriptional regulator DNA-binding domain-containing protein n=1 Tax=Clostridium intestinale TaxID=36845 RepID=A0A7D6VNF9_9CLOT|nr:LytTR family DNA-binding domain-containing protein [Clostridium intestinale]QLY77928.1 LytTR family transcriptional regulator DNA-binding domain-containing protein [Clostridium intestinale]
MKILIEESPDNEDTELIIKCKSLNDEVKRIIELIKLSDEKIIGFLNGESYVVDPIKILYFESVDKKTFMYTEDKVYEISLRLYELEKKMSKYDFFRSSKSTIINISRIKKLSHKFNGKLEATLDNDEKLLISRQYVSVIKEILGF